MRDLASEQESQAEPEGGSRGVLRVAVFELDVIETIEVALEVELLAEEVRGGSEAPEIVAVQGSGLVRETQRFERIVPRTTVVARSAVLEVRRHRSTT